MRITFDNMSQTNISSEKIKRTVATQGANKAYGCQVTFDGKDRVGFGMETFGTAKSSMPPVMDGAETQVQNMRDQLTIMSHTMSDEDFAKMQKEGYDPSEMAPEEAVTILDKIKAELLKAGKHIAGYTDNMDMTTLAAAVGNQALAADLAKVFEAQDIPLEKQNVEQTLWALDIAKQLKAPTQDAYYYMAANDMHATLKDFYMAASSGAQVEMEQSPQYFGEEVKGYITKNIAPDKTQSSEALDMEQEIDKLLQQLGLEGSEEEKFAATWLVEKGLPADKQCIVRMKDIFVVQFPLQQEAVMKMAAAAIADGIPVGEKNLADTSTYLEKSIALYNAYQGEDAVHLVKNQRQLEEIRLHMTVEANLKLLESGFSVDTAPIEETIEALKQVEQQLAKQYFPQDAQADIKYQLYKETEGVLCELPGLPVATVGVWTQRLQQDSLTEFYAEGTQLANAYKEAGEQYEKLWTAPRADMGDNIKKAFANVDEILKDLKYETTEENRKAVRILGYNRMELIVENVEKVKAALSSVEKVIQKMTPAATLQMIRDDINPLEMSLSELGQYFEEQPQEYSQNAEKYSKFLYQLDKAGEITPEERDAFIGCYRLLNQIEKSDGAVIGSIVNTGSELNFANLLSAVRSGKFKSMDVRVDNTIGALIDAEIDRFSISEQINRGYEKEAAEGYRQQVKEAASVPEEVFLMLERGQIEPSTQNLLAGKVLEQQAYTLFKQLLKKDTKDLRSFELLESKEEFIKEYTSDIEEAAKALAKDSVLEGDTILDVRSRKLIHKQLHIMQKLSPQEEYYFPMEIDGQITGVHVQFTHSEEEQGLVRLTLDSPFLGQLKGQLQVTDAGVEGYFVGNQEEVIMNLKKASDIINTSLGKAWKSCQVEFVHSETNNIPMNWTRKSAETQVSNEALYGLAKSFLQAVKAVGDGIGENEYEN